MVAKHQNLTATAEAMGRSQAAVSQHIRHLENELGVQLVVPGRRGITLTPAGLRLALAADDSLARLARGVRAVDELTNPECGTLRVVTGGTTVRHFMGAAIASFRRDYPSVRVELHSAGSTRRCIGALHQDQADLAFITITDELAEIDVLPTIESDWTLVKAARTKRERRTGITLAELPEGTFISLHPTSISGRQLVRQIARTGLHRPSDTRVDDWDTAIALAELELGYALVPDLHATNLKALHHISLTPVTDLSSLTFGWATPNHRLLPGPARKFVELFPTTLKPTTTARTRLVTSQWQSL